MVPGRKATAARALILLARRLEFRAGILELCSADGFRYAVLELRNAAGQYRKAASAMRGEVDRPTEGDRKMAAHNVYMRYERALGMWRVSFASHGSRAQFRELTFADPDKIEELARRANALPDLSARQALDMGIRKGMGGLMLHLDDAQLARLRL